MKKILFFMLAFFVGQAKSMETASFTPAQLFAGSLGVGLVGLGIHCYDRLNHANAIKKYNEKAAPLQKMNEDFGEKIRLQNYHGLIPVSQSNKKRLQDVCGQYNMAEPSRTYVGPRVGIQGSVGFSAQIEAQDRNIMYLPKEAKEPRKTIIEDGFEVNKMLKVVVMENESNKWDAAFQESFLNGPESLSFESKDKIEKDSPGWKKMYPYCVSVHEIYDKLPETPIYFIKQELPEMPQYAPIFKHPKIFFSAWFAITSGIALYWIKSKK